MKTTRMVMKEVEEADYVCDRCGGSLRVATDETHSEIRGLVGGQETGGYFGTFPPDLERWRFDLCEGCTAWLASQMQRYPAVGSVLLGTGSVVDEPAYEPVRLAIQTGDFAPLMNSIHSVVSCLRALARRQDDPATFKQLDDAATAVEREALLALTRAMAYNNEATGIVRNVLYPDDIPDDPREAVERARAKLPGLGATLYSRNRTLRIIAEGEMSAEEMVEAARRELAT